MGILDYIRTVLDAEGWLNGAHYYSKLIVNAVLTLLWVMATVSHRVLGIRVVLTVDASGSLRMGKPEIHHVRCTGASKWVCP